MAAPTKKIPTPDTWAATKYTYQWLPKRMYEDLIGIDDLDIMEALSNSENDDLVPLIMMKIGDVGCRMLKNSVAERFNLKNADKIADAEVQKIPGFFINEKDESIVAILKFAARLADRATKA